MQGKILNLKIKHRRFFFDEEKTYVCCVFLSARQSLTEIIDAYIGRL